MSRPLQTALKALENAVNNLKNESAAKSLKTGTALLKKVKPGDALTAEQAQNLVAFFDEELAILYSLLPQLTVKLSTVYFTDLFRVFKAEPPPELWQHVAGKGILSGLLAFMQTENAGVDTHFDKTFVTALCQLLNNPSSSKKLELSTNFRRCVGSFLAAVAANDEKAKKWMLESKFLGIIGLSSLIINETEFRILDACLEIATRLAPKRSDPQARRAFFTDLFNSKLAKTTFGEEACKRLLRVMEQPVKGRTWFEIADQMFAEMGGNADRLQRFVTEHLVVSGQTFSEKNASVRMYLDTEITFNAFLLAEDEELMITTSFDNLSEIQIDYMEGKAKLALNSPPSWENPNEQSSQATSTVITLQLSAPEMIRFQKVLKLRGQGAKLVDHAKHTKQSFSVHPTQLGQSDPPAPPPLQAKAAVLKGFVPSPTPIDLSTSPLNPSKGPIGADLEKLPEAQPELYRLPSSPLVPQQPLVSSHRKSVVKATTNGVRGGVIIDSDDDLGEGPLTKSAAKPGLKRKASELSEMDNDVQVLSPEPVRKKLRVERTDPGTKPSSSKKGLPKNSKPLALDDSTKINKQIQAKVPTVAAISLKPRKPTPPQIHSRINGMRAKDGTRPTAASTPLRRGRPVKTDVPRSVQEHSQRPVKEIPEGKPATLPVRRARSKAKPEKAIWETEDFSQKAVLMFPPTGAIVKEKFIIDEAVAPDYDAEDVVLDNEVEAIIVPDIEPAAGEDISETPGPPNFSRKLDTPVQDDGPSSPIRPVMALKRKLRDADTLSQRLHAQIPPANASPIASVIKRAGNLAPYTDDDQSLGPNRNDTEAMYRPLKESKRNPAADSLRSFLPIKDGQKRRPAVNWAVPINPSRLGPITGPGDAKQSGVDKSSKVSLPPKKGIRDADRKVPKHKALPPPPSVETTDNESGSEAEQREVTPAPPKSDTDGIAEVLTAIQDTILKNIQSKFSGVRREARLARASLLENAVVDLEVMQENHDKSFARFMRLEEKCGEVTQDIIGGLEEVDATNQAIIANIDAIIREHDEVTAAFRAARKPLFSKLPPCLEV